MLALAALILAVGPVKLVAPPMTGAGVDAAKLRIFTSSLAQSLRAAGLEVITSDEIAVLLGAERQKQLLGCSDESCLAELGSALGTSATVKASVAKLDEVYQVGVTVLGNDTRILAEHSARASSESEVVDALDDAARALARSLGVSPPRRLKPVAWVPALLGALSMGTGAALLVQAKNAYQNLSSNTFLPGQGELVARDGSNFQVAGLIALGLGAALVLTGVLLYLVGPQ